MNTSLVPGARAAALCALAALFAAACGGGGGESAADAEAPAPVADGPAPAPGAAPAPPPGAAPAPAPAPAPIPQEAGTARSSARIFFSGHSLMDNPLEEDVIATAAALGGTAKFNQQIGIGSTIQARTKGPDANAAGWPGYSVGENRDGQGMNVINELRNPQTLGGDRYDTLVVTEGAELLNSIYYLDTVRYLRHMHERLHEGNAAANTYFYQPWYTIANKASPGAWVANERAMAPVAQCVATRINTSLAHEGRSDRVIPLPANLALATLVERAAAGQVPGLAGASAVFNDSIHLSPAGIYFMSQVTYASVFRRSPAGAPAPAAVSSQTAGALQALAWEVVANYYAALPDRSLAECQTAMAQACTTFFAYDNDPAFGTRCADKFRAQTNDNPFYFNAATDASYWFPAP